MCYYDPTETTTSTRVKSIQQTAGNYSVTYAYTYDGNGNILSISDGTNTITYKYDVNNQLIREDDPIAGTSREFQIRANGAPFIDFCVPYTTGTIQSNEPSVFYDIDSEWGDMLTGINFQPMTRDEIGNLLSYNGVTYTWEHGRELSTMADSTGTWAFTYDANGMRTKKVKTNTSGSVTDTYTYVYNGSQLSQMTKNGNVLNFFYDGEGRPAYFTYNNATYYYVTNLQGDVIAILDSMGNVMVNYHYDAYGVLLQTGGTMAATLGTLNPLTYRGYVYDHETGLYYLQSRYYNPEIKRFISPDAYLSTGQGFMGYNMFAYCNNNPVNLKDKNGANPTAVLPGWISGMWWLLLVDGALPIGDIVYTVGTVVLIASAVYDCSNINYSVLDDAVASAPTPPAPNNNNDDDNDDLSEKQEVGKGNDTSLSRGSTGRTEPNNLKEKLAMEQVRANPLDGAHRLKFKMADPRWPASEGWVKMANNVNGVEIHFVYNTIIQVFDDFKFKE